MTDKPKGNVAAKKTAHKKKIAEPLKYTQRYDLLSLFLAITPVSLHCFLQCSIKSTMQPKYWGLENI